MREIVSDRNGWEDDRKDTGDNQQTLTVGRHQTGVGTAPPDSPRQHRSTRDQKADEIERKFHSGCKVNHKIVLVSRRVINRFKRWTGCAVSFPSVYFGRLELLHNVERPAEIKQNRE